MKLKLTKEQVELLEELTSKVYVNSNEYSHMPFWLKKLDNNTYEILTFQNLPDELVEELKDERNKLGLEMEST